MDDLRPLACLARYGYHHVKWGRGLSWSRLCCYRCGESQGAAYNIGKLVIEYMDDVDRVKGQFDVKGVKSDYQRFHTLNEALAYLGIQ